MPAPAENTADSRHCCNNCITPLMDGKIYHWIFFFFIYLTDYTQTQRQSPHTERGETEEMGTAKRFNIWSVRVCKGERHLRGRRHPLRLYFSKLSFRESLCLSLCFLSPATKHLISRSHPSVTQHPTDQTLTSPSSPPFPSPFPSHLLFLLFVSLTDSRRQPQTNSSLKCPPHPPPPTPGGPAL